MTIEEYKKQLISVVQNMEREHGCDINSVSISANLFSESSGLKVFRVEIDM